MVRKAEEAVMAKEGKGEKANKALPWFVAEFGFSSMKWEYGGASGRVISLYMERAGQTLVGEEALRALTGASYIRTPEALVKYYPKFLAQAMKEAGVAEQVRVVVGLPAGYWEEQRAISGGAIDQLENSLRSDLVHDVVVLPQGLGGIQAYLDTPGALKSGLILGVDFGFNTVISTLFDLDNNYVVTSETMWDRGVSQMIKNYLEPKIVEHASGRGMNPVERARLIENGYIQTGFTNIDITPEIKMASHEYMNDTLGELLEIMKGNISAVTPIGAVVFFGGGANYLDKFDAADLPTVILDRPEHSNANGFKRLVESMEE